METMTGQRTVQRHLDDEERRWLAVRAAVLGTDAEGRGEQDWIGDHDRAGHHPADLASDTTERELDFGLLAEADAMLDEVAEARRRLATGAYGLCQTCGEQIPAARLLAVPATRYCVTHERAVEPRWSSGAVGRDVGSAAASRRMRA